MKTLLILLFPLWTYSQTITNTKGELILSINQSNDTTVISININEVEITVMKDVANNDMLFIKAKDEHYTNWFVMYQFYYFRPLE